MKRGFLKTAKGKQVISINELRARVNGVPAESKQKIGISSNLEEKKEKSPPDLSDYKKDQRIVHHLVPLDPDAIEEEIWKATHFTEDAPSNMLDYETHELVCSTQPAKLNDATRETNPDSWSECLISGWVKRTILNTASFPQPLSQPDQIKHRVSETATSTKPLPGMYATETLVLGDLVLSERPLLITPAMMRAGEIFSVHLTREQMDEVAIKQWGKVLKTVFGRMPKGDQEAFWNLRDIYQKDDKKSITGIIQTNGLRVVGLEDPGLKDLQGSYSGVCAVLSQINHSCRPNAERYWDMASFSFQLRAMRKIDKDEEITISFINQLQPYATRKAELTKFKIVCSCPSCKKPKLADKRLAQFEKGTPTNEEYANWIMDASLSNEHIIKRALVQISLLEADGFEISPFYEINLDMIMKSYIALGDEKKAMRWGKKLGTWLTCRGGPQKAEEFQKSERYTKSPLWKARTNAIYTQCATTQALFESQKA